MSELSRFPENNVPCSENQKSNEIPCAPDLKGARRSFSRLGLGVFVILAATTLLQSLFVLLADHLWPGWAVDPWGMWIISYVPMYLVAVPLGLLIFRTVPAVSPQKQRLSPGTLAVTVIICFFMMYAGNLTGIFLTSLLQLLPGITALNPVVSMTTSTELLPRTLFVVIAAPLIEEFIFRKQLIDRMQLYGQKTAVVVSAALFGLFHGNLSQFFYAFALGLVFGYVYVKTGKLRYCVGLHMLINFLGGVFAPLLLEKLPFTPEGMLDPEAAVAALPWLMLYVLYAFSLVGLSLAGLVLLCVNRRRITFSPGLPELPRKGRFRTVWCNAGMLLAAAGCFGLIAVSLFL